MRIDNSDPNREYENYWDWLRDVDHAILIIASIIIWPTILLGYAIYRKNTKQV